MLSLADVTTRWLFGDQLGPHFTDDHDVLLRRQLVEVRQPERDSEPGDQRVPLRTTTHQRVGDVAEAAVLPAHQLADRVGDLTSQATVGVVDPEQLHPASVVGPLEQAITLGGLSQQW